MYSIDLDPRTRWSWIYVSFILLAIELAIWMSITFLGLRKKNVAAQFAKADIPPIDPIAIRTRSSCANDEGLKVSEAIENKDDAYILLVDELQSV